MDKCNCCENSELCKITQRTEGEKKRLINRLNRIEGQIRGIKGMIESDAYCVDILTQSAAANAAFKAFNKELLARHINTCVVRDIKNGNEQVTDELMDIISKLIK
ncbi:MAG: metal-sensing transcriptional repressor [Clostridia bacterium]|nr:metal-sensing transcriptional repressor [Clostridia bacterium]